MGIHRQITSLSAIGISSTTRNQPHFNQNQTSRDNFLTSTSTTISHFTMSSTYSQPQSHFSSSPSQEYDIESSFTLSAYTREMHQHTKKQMEAASISTEEERQCRWHKRARQTRSVMKRVEYGQQPVIVNEQRSEDGYNPSYQFVDYIPRACR